MADAQNSLPQGDGGGGPNSKQISSLQDRFAALSHLASLTPTNKKGKSGNAAADLKNHSNHLKDTAMGRHEQEGLESRLDHHSPSPQDSVDMARKILQGLQEPVLESVSLPSVRSSGSHKLNPLASPFDVMPIKTKEQSTLVEPEIHTSALESTRVSRRQRSKGDLASANVFLGHFNPGEVIEAIEEMKEEDKSVMKISVDEVKLAKNAIGVGVVDKIPYIKTEDMDDGQSLQFTSEVEEPEEIQLKDNHIKLELLIEQAGTLCLETATGKAVPNPTLINHVVKFDNPGSYQVPDAILSRYPRMAKYLTTLVAQEGPTRLAVSNTSVPLVTTILQQKPISGEGKTTIKKEKPGSFVLQPGSISTPTLDKETGLCPRVQISSIPQEFPLETGNIMPSCILKTPIFGATFASRIEKSHEVSIQKDAMQPREMSPSVSLEKSMEVATPERKLETAISPFQERILEQPPSTRPTLLERYAIPIRNQSSEATTPKASARAGGGGRGDEESPQQMGKAPLMEQLAMVDERFSRDSGDIFARHSSSLSRCSSMSSEASLTFSISPDTLAASAQASKCVDQTRLEDSDRFRRSMGPSPSPHRGQEVGFPVATAGNMGPIDFGHPRKAADQATDQKNMAGNWLDQFSNSAKNTDLLLPRGQPSVLARIHEDICEDEGDSDGIAPGEWIKPVELLQKGPTKAKIDNIVQFGLPLLPDASGPLPESVKGGVTGSTHHTQRSKGPGQPKYPHRKLPHSRILQDGTSADCSIPGAMQPNGLVGNVGASATEKAKKKNIVIMEWCEEEITEMGKLDEKAREDLRRPFVEDDWQRKGKSEQERVKWRAPREGGLFISPPSSVHGTSALLPQSKTRMVSGRDSGRGSGSMLSHPVRQPQHQQRMCLIKDFANNLWFIKTHKGTPKAGVVNSTVPNINDSSARISQSNTDQITSASGSQTFMALPLFDSKTVPPAPSVTSGKIAQVKQPFIAAYVRKLCPLFFTGPCHRGQNCLDLHPNYDKQSGIHEDKRFATQEAFSEEILMNAKTAKDRDKALEELVRESRDDADKECHGTQPGVDIKQGRPRPMTLQVGSVTVGRNARGETEWTVEPPKKTERVEEEPVAEPEHTKPKKQGKRRAQA